MASLPCCSCPNYATAAGAFPWRQDGSDFKRPHYQPFGTVPAPVGCGETAGTRIGRRTWNVTREYAGRLTSKAAAAGRATIKVPAISATTRWGAMPSRANASYWAQHPGGTIQSSAARADECQGVRDAFGNVDAELGQESPDHVDELGALGRLVAETLAQNGQPLLVIEEQQEIVYRTVGRIHGIEGVAELVTNAPKPGLVNFNTVQSAAATARHLRRSGREVFHLSTALCPEDRGRALGCGPDKLHEENARPTPLKPAMFPQRRRSSPALRRVASRRNASPTQ